MTRLIDPESDSKGGMWRHPDEMSSQSSVALAFREAQSPVSGRVWRDLSDAEITALESRGNWAQDWTKVKVADGFSPSQVTGCRFEGWVRIGRMSGRWLADEELKLPVGLYHSRLVQVDVGDECAIHHARVLMHTVMGDRVLISDASEVTASLAPKFGVGLADQGTPDASRHWLDVGQERGRRAVLPFVGMLPADVELFSRERDDPGLLERLKALVDASEGDPSGRYNVIGHGASLRNCRSLRDVRIGEEASIKGANKLKNITVQSSPEARTHIGEGVEMVNGIMGYGSRAFYGVKAVRFLLGDGAQLKYGARLIHSTLGNNSTLSCCEVLNAQVGPAHEQHHNDSFLIAASLGGQSNIAAGATLGSNHNGRVNDGEMRAGRGFWAGLCTSIALPSRFASYTLLAQGSYPFEMNQTLPFSLVQREGDRLVIQPAWWWTRNAYALARNADKYAKRDHRAVKRQPIVSEPLAPDTVGEVLSAMAQLQQWKTSVHASGDVEADQDWRLPIGHGVCSDRMPVWVRKPVEGLQAYASMVAAYVAQSLLDGLEHLEASQGGGPIDIEGWLESLSAEIDAAGTWRFLGGLPMPEADWRQLREDVKDGTLSDVKALHARYDELWSRYPRARCAHAWSLAERVLGDKASHPRSALRGLLLTGMRSLEAFDLGVGGCRARDFERPLRQHLLRDAHEVAPGMHEDGFWMDHQRLAEARMGRLRHWLQEIG